MLEKRKGLTFLSHLVLLTGVIILCFPIYLAWVASSHTSAEIMGKGVPLWPGDQFIQNYYDAFMGSEDGLHGTMPIGRMFWVSCVMAFIIVMGKISISLLSAFAIVYFRFPFRKLCFWAIFITLMLPVEVRIGPTFEVVANLGMINTYAGLTIPLIASATATFLFRQFFMTVPDELIEAAHMDGAGPMRFFWSILVPLSKPSIAALIVIQFIYSWNQYLWPLLSATQESMYPLAIGIRQMSGDGDTAVSWNIVMASIILMLIPPTLIIIGMQRWLVKGLVDTDK